MELIDKIVLPIHIVAGFISLVLFWLPIFVKKGGQLHIKIGWFYTYGMWVVVASAAILSVINTLQGDYFVALFLGYLTLITSMPLWYGISVLKFKKEVNLSMFRRKRLLHTLIVIVGAVNVIYAMSVQFANGSMLLFIFGLLGVFDIRDARLSFEDYQSKIDPIKDHITGMLTTGIAAYTAFFAFGGRTWLGEIFTGQLMIIPWVLPTIIGVVAIKWYTRKWVRKPAL